jgi:predicted flap endonuclease-1-like 5' DNA nuclease
VAQKTKRSGSTARGRVHLEKDRPAIDVEGIGPAFAARLGALGIRTVHELEDADADDLAPQIGTHPSTFRQWQSMAELIDVHGVGPQYAELLVRSGVSSVRELAASDPDQLVAAIEAAEAGREHAIQGGPEGRKSVARWIEAAKRHPRARPEPPAPEPAAPVHHERIVVIPTALYWTCLLLSLLFLALAAGLYRDYLSNYLFGVAYYLYWVTVVFAVIVIAWTTLGLLRRGRVVHRTVKGTRAVVAGVTEGVRNRSEANEGAMGRLAAKWTQRFARLVRAVVWIVGLPWRIAVWAWYTAEKLVWRIVLVLYDILYYPTYAAWLLAHWAIRTAVRIVVWALGVAWKVLRLPLYLPLVRRWWRKSMRPKILKNWRASVAHQRHLGAMRIERGRRLAQLRGENPDRWEADHKRRRGFPLPHPEKGRVRIRKRIAHIQETQRARREGRPVPKRPRLPKERQENLEEPRTAEPETPAAGPEGKRRLTGILRGGKASGAAAGEAEGAAEP